MLQQAVILVKPDGLQRGLVGEIITRFERKGLKIIAMKMTELTSDTIDSWYEHHKNKPFFPGLKSFMSSTPIIAFLVEGVEAIESVRIICGSTNARKADAGSVRGDFGMGFQMNLIHASDSEEAAAKERSLIFGDQEVFDYDKDIEVHIYTEDEK